MQDYWLKGSFILLEENVNAHYDCMGFKATVQGDLGKNSHDGILKMLGLDIAEAERLAEARRLGSLVPPGKLGFEESVVIGDVLYKVQELVNHRFSDRYSGMVFMWIFRKSVDPT